MNASPLALAGLAAGLVAGLAGVLVAGCSDPPPPRSPEPATLTVAEAHQTCPLGVRNAHVVFQETATGGALVFSSGPEQIAELRTRARDTAEMHGSGRHMGEGHDGFHGNGGGRHGVNHQPLPPVTTTYEDTAEGARIAYAPKSPEDFDTLRARLKTRAEFLMARCRDDDGKTTSR